MHKSIDEKFEVLLTNNPYTDIIFNDATALKTQKKRTRQVVLNFRETKYINERQLKKDQVTSHEDNEVLAGTKRKGSLAEQAFSARQKLRPHAFESSQLQTIVSNINLLHQMGFLEADVLANDTVNRVMAENDSAVSNVRKRGRPRKFDLSYEDMMNVDKWDDSKLVFQQGLISGGMVGGHEEEERNEGGPVLQANGVLTSAPKKQVQTDGSVDICGICYNPGKLICCDDCPAAFHTDCLGYER